jgi:UDP-N-acetylglucosamine 2-epimerase (non-hydrolysing)
VKRRVLVVFGTRPEAIKMAPVVRALKARENLQCRVCVTAQHRSMLDQVLDAFDLVPDIDLDLMRPGQDLSSLTAALLLGMRDVLAAERPDLVLVHGDTTTALGATLAAFYARVPVGHVEAGLRTGDLMAPWPEEANRVLADRLTALHFAPTPRARDALLAEGIRAEGIHVTGNTVVDALLWMVGRVRDLPLGAFGAVWGSAADALDSAAPIVLVTGHRRESFGLGFEHLCAGIARVARAHPEAHVVYPVHLNPQVQEPVHRLLGGLQNVHLLAPLDYRPFVRLMDRCTLILTDSGGIQEEAPSLGKPVLVMRRVTERPEGVEAGTVRLVGTDPDAIFAEVSALIADPARAADFRRAANPYGDGHAAERIAEIVAR